MNKIRIIAFSIAVIFSACPSLSAQDILTATDYFDRISEQYSDIYSYQATVTITRDDTVMYGDLYYRSPNRLRIDFENPDDQVLLVDGSLLTIYIPRHSVIMQQQLKRNSSASGAAMVTGKGLDLMKRNYSIAFLEGPDPVPLEEGSGMLVRKLKLVWRSPDAGFRQLILSVTEAGYIRRIEGITHTYDKLQFDFTGIAINVGIPYRRFEYDSPGTANIFNNFLFEPEG